MNLKMKQKMQIDAAYYAKIWIFIDIPYLFKELKMTRTFKSSVSCHLSSK